MPERFAGIDVAREYHRKFPEAATLTLAKKMHRENGALFHSVEHARTTLRNARGNNGKQGRAKIKSDCFRPNGTPTVAPFAALPEGRTTLEWGAYHVDGPASVLVISDIHIPYHDAGALRVALQEGRDRDVNLILLGGDITDHYSLSRWEKDPRLRNFKDEVETTKKFLAMLHEEFPKARLIWKEGNHEERFTSYMKRCAPDLLGMPQFSMQACYDMGNYGVEFVGEKRPIGLGKLNFVHGHEYTFAISNPVNPARGLFLRAKVHAMMGHLHQTSQHSETNLKGEIVSTFSIGCLSELHPEYRPLNNWGHGYAHVEIDNKGAFEVTNRRIINGRAY